MDVIENNIKCDYVNPSYKGKYQPVVGKIFSGEWFSVYFVDYKTIKVELKKNETPNDRYIKIYLDKYYELTGSNEGAFGCLPIKQTAK